MIYDALAGLLKADPQITAIVAGRVYFVTAPAGGTYPDIIQYPASGFMMGDDLEGVEPPWQRRVSFECRGEVYGGAAGVHALGDHVIRVLNNWSGVAVGEQIQDSRLMSDVADFDETSSIRRRIMDFRVVHSPV